MSRGGSSKRIEGEGSKNMFSDVDIVVDLQTGAISVLLPLDENGGNRIELEHVTPEDAFAPRE